MSRHILGYSMVIKTNMIVNNVRKKKPSHVISFYGKEIFYYSMRLIKK